MDSAKIEAGVRLILEGVGENPDRDGLIKTPERVARMYEEIFAGMNEDPAVHFETTFDEGHRELVLVSDIEFFSICEHHLLPFMARRMWLIFLAKTGASVGSPSWRVW